jgi:hypothetical protein
LHRNALTFLKKTLKNFLGTLAFFQSLIGIFFSISKPSKKMSIEAKCKVLVNQRNSDFLKAKMSIAISWTYKD